MRKPGSRVLQIAFIFLGFGVFVLLAFFSAINFFPAIFPEFSRQLMQEKKLVESPKSRQCAECHTQIAASWEKSRHFLSWTSESYIKDSENRTKEKCLPCHIPREVDAGEKPTARIDARSDGIDCVSCHIKNKTMRGPYDLYAPPHPTQQETAYRESLFCQSCHRKTYEEWEKTRVATTCQSCHMPGKSDWLTQKFPFNLLHVRRSVADHQVPRGRILEEDLKIRSALTGNRVKITLVNQGLPHAYPTADNGDPRLYLEVSFIDKTGEVLDKSKEIFAPQLETALQYRVPVEVMFFVPGETDRIEARLLFRQAGSKEKEEVRFFYLDVSTP